MLASNRSMPVFGALILKSMIKCGTMVSITNYNNAKHNLVATRKQNRLYFNIHNIYKLISRLQKKHVQILDICMCAVIMRSRGKHRQPRVHKTYCFPRSQSISILLYSISNSFMTISYTLPCCNFLACASMKTEISWQKEFYAFGRRNARKNILLGH